ncbi:penicillin acylase family protein [Polymorphobacter fuscus]|uniref:Acylase n=1 Tax=Sandarakinorhabdus fusca TaxID=1439888 RepID=A0A7C9KZN4_9SPHN|nr:penicillin acylase family protein [Polymorphobacter fuscus]KAB7644941.1 acylase [Polymorphobacter fuscus]MQT18228.1 acylase [Polymorphobacter fuscus]NJC09551.1 acyl-homoserine-lactone acylase [Polymorphobacter fuscus]
MKILLIAAMIAAAAAPATAAAPDMARWQAQAARVTIRRDDWGIAHVHGRTDADAVFGMIYAQAEDDFNRVETNFINAQGRLAEAEGEAAIWRDLRMKLFITPEALKADYARSPAWLKDLMVAWADALNFYLATHPQVKPRVITHFEPWMALSFSEGSIGGDIESVSLGQLEAFYGQKPVAPSAVETGARRPEPLGSNGFAIAPSHSRDGHALLLINPHTSFFFRSEAKVESDAGLNVYGAATWGQFFTYQGFNATAGWMHTTSGADAVDEYVETTRTVAGRTEYRFGTEWRPMTLVEVTVPYRDAAGVLQSRRFTTFRTVHGPVVRAADGKWISVALMNKPLAALEQSFLRTKAADLAGFLKVAERKANSSNNTIFASAKGEIAYLHPQFMPRRDDRFDYSRPVDGSDPATAWQGEHALSELPQVLTPKNGWVTNTNNWPWHAAGADSPSAAAFPRYMDKAGENPRGPNAVRVLSARRDFTVDSLLAAAYDSYLTGFASLVPTLVAAYDRLPAADPQRAALAAPIAALRGWDYRSSETSVPMALATFWGESLVARFGAAARQDDEALVPFLVARPSDADRLDAFAEATERLTRDFGTWDTPWGQINRFQRLTGDLVQPFDDSKPSLPIGFSSSQWGSLPAFGARPWPGTKRWYGTYGNSFVAVVEFGPAVSARAISAGGQSGDPASPHFNDQAERYRSHDFRRVYFTDAALKGHVERSYRPGE